MSSRSLTPVYYPLALIGVGVVFLVILRAIDAAAVSAMWTNFLSVFAPGGGSTAKTTMEMQPFLSPQGTFSTAVAWGNFTTSFFLTKYWPIPGFALISFAILIWLGTKQRGEKENHIFFIIWTLVILVATLAQRRFAYYFAVNVALLSAYISWQIIWFAGLRRLAQKPEKGPESEKVEKAKARTKKKQPTRQGLGTYYVYTILAIVVTLFFVCFWNITKSKEVASSAPYAPSNGWEESLNWMKDNTPDPMGDPGAYYKLYDLDFKYPASAYGVAAWWDYGYWISRTAHRFPSTNPSQDPKPITKVANLFLATDKDAADKIMAELESDYIIADYELATSKLWAVVDWAGQDQNKYFSVYYVANKGYVQVFNPDYYRTLVVRLYNFNGKAVTSEKPIVVTYDEKVQNGIRYKQVTNAEEYPSYKAAQDYIASQKSGKYDIVGASPFVSPVPLEAVQGYKLVYSSQYLQSYSQNATIPEIKIFEHVK
jgi:dolichyl-diphosphooligosaccharide--protein glycosyltransferase